VRGCRLRAKSEKVIEGDTHMRKHNWKLATRLGWAQAIVLLLAVAVTQLAQAQTYTVLHNFSGPDGAAPSAGLIMDSAGNLYGSTIAGGQGTCRGNGCGTVYKFKPSRHGGTITTLYEFTGGADGGLPEGVVFGPDHTLYGNAHGGGLQKCIGDAGNPGCGVVFNLKRSPTTSGSVPGPWLETVIYTFIPVSTGGSDANNPIGALVFDRYGTIYGTSEFGGDVNCGYGAGCGTVFQLVPSGGNESVLYSFTNDGINGYRTYAGVVFDKSGNLYGTTYFGPGGTGCSFEVGCGTVYELTPSGSEWTQNTLHAFQSDSDGGYSASGLIFDKSGNLYGATGGYGSGGGGTVFQLTPSGGSWTYKVLKAFSSAGTNCGPQWSLTIDDAGNLYGTTYCDGKHQYGNVFELSLSGGEFTYKSLHEFKGGFDGAYPEGGLVLDDSNGNIYGTASAGGASGDGVVFEITP
jgi:uncharacterized repeat protein (TIGR03803 family)